MDELKVFIAVVGIAVAFSNLVVTIAEVEQRSKPAR